MNSGAEQPVRDHVPTQVAQLHSIELVISSLLRIGVIASMLLILLGVAVSFVRHPAYATSSEELPALIHPHAGQPHTLFDVFAGLRHFRGQAVVALGLLVLIATPMMRVAVSILAFYYAGDRLYTLITLAVFCLLLLSLALGAAG
jgi:uncharacterized membrane protein